MTNKALADKYERNGYIDIASDMDGDELKQVIAALRAQPEGAPHPWAAFLEARANAIDWMHAEGKSDAEIAASLSMDSAEQVFLIRTRERRGPQLHDDGH